MPMVFNIIKQKGLFAKNSSISWRVSDKEFVDKAAGCNKKKDFINKGMTILESAYGFYESVHPQSKSIADFVYCAAWVLEEMDVDKNVSEFARDLYGIISTETQSSGKCGVNVIISPASIHSSLALVFMGAAAKSADELRSVLKLGVGDKVSIAKDLSILLEKDNCNSADITLKMVNRLYVNNTLELNSDFNNMAIDYFGSEAEQVEFENAEAVTTQINEWVKQETNDKITQLLQPDAVDANTSAMIISALYFKGKWQKPFSPDCTLRDDFYIDFHKRVEVDMMYQDDDFNYANLQHLNATAVELNYEKSDLSMLVILPNAINGLADLEMKLLSMDWKTIDDELKMEKVEIALPKFVIEYDLDLKMALQKMGVNDIFSDTANLSNLFTTKVGQKISNVRHRGFIDVNEAGSEAAAATFMKLVPMMLVVNKKTFKADHPFLFCVRSKSAVYFVGRVACPDGDNSNILESYQNTMVSSLS